MQYFMLLLLYLKSPGLHNLPNLGGGVPTQTGSVVSLVSCLYSVSFLLSIICTSYKLCYHIGPYIPPILGVSGNNTAETLRDPYHKQVPLPSIPVYRAQEATT